MEPARASFFLTEACERSGGANGANRPQDHLQDHVNTFYLLHPYQKLPG
jgi:hypothetical protein